MPYKMQNDKRMLKEYNKKENEILKIKTPYIILVKLIIYIIRNFENY